MSAEVETNKDEAPKEQQKKPSLKKKVLRQWQIAIKLLELVLCIICLVCAFKSVETLGLGRSDLHHVGIMYTAYTGYILINTIFLISCFLNETIPYRTSALFSISAAALFLITGVLLLVDRSANITQYSYDPSMKELVWIIVSAVFSFLNVTVFATDAVYTFLTRLDF